MAKHRERLSFLFVVRVAAAACTAVWCVGAVAAGSEPGETLKIPGLPPVAMPPGVHVYGPGSGAPAAPDADLYHEYGTVVPGGGRRHRVPETYGTVIGPGGVFPQPEQPRPKAQTPKKKVLTPEERQAKIRKALAPKPPLAEAKRRTLDDLYDKLAAAKDEDEAKGYASLIAAIWNRSGSDTADLLMSRAQKALEAKNLPVALQVLDKVIELKPNWAEAWDKRAVARYVSGDLNGSMSDVDHVLKLEPKHFAALAGLAVILQQTGFEKRALEVFRRDLAIYPLQPTIKKMVDDLALKVEGQGI